MEANKQQQSGGGGLSPLSETLWRSKENKNTSANFIRDASAWLTWKDLTVTVTLGSRGETQRVLDGLTGYAEPCTLMALMGPSGSGKSTLLDALAGRLAANAFLSGDILLNGRKTKMSYGTAVSAFKKKKKNLSIYKSSSIHSFIIGVHRRMSPKTTTCLER